MRNRTGSQPRRGQGFSLLALAAVCVAVSVLVAGARPPGRSAPAADASATRAIAMLTAAAKTTPTPLDTSGFPSLPSGYQLQGATMSPVVQQAARPKVSITLHPFSVLAQVHNVPQGHVPPYWVDSDANLYVDSPLGSTQRFGLFAPVVVSILGFGMLPVRATLTLSQPDAGGSVSALHLAFSWTGAPESDGYLYQQNLLLTGAIEVRISNVSVDRVPLDVGSNCQTVQPASFVMHGPDGKYKTSPDIRVPGNLYLPFGRPPGSLTGDVDIPDFSGCHNGNEDLDPLISAMVSGAGNALTVTQVAPLSGYTPPIN